MDKQRDFVLRTIEERGVKFVRLWFTDVIGTLKSVAIAPAEVEGAFTEGLGFDGSAIEGLTRSYESDLLAHPDPTTFQILPWRGEIDPTARMFCDITTPDGQPAVADPRNVLKRSLAKAADARLHLLHAPRDRVLPAEVARSSAPRARSRSTPPATSTTCRAAPRTTSAAARCGCSRISASRSSSATTRAGPGRTRSTCATPTR